MSYHSFFFYISIKAMIWNMMTKTLTMIGMGSWVTLEVKNRKS